MPPRKPHHMLPLRGQDDKVARRLVHEPQTRSWARQLRTAMRPSQMTRLWEEAHEDKCLEPTFPELLTPLERACRTDSRSSWSSMYHIHIYSKLLLIGAGSLKIPHHPLRLRRAPSQQTDTTLHRSTAWRNFSFQRYTSISHTRCSSPTAFWLARSRATSTDTSLTCSELCIT